MKKSSERGNSRFELFYCCSTLVLLFGVKNTFFSILATINVKKALFLPLCVKNTQNCLAVSKYICTFASKLHSNINLKIYKNEKEQD